MNEVFVSHISADEYYSELRALGREIDRVFSAPFSGAHSPDFRKNNPELKLLDNFSRPVHLMVPNSSSRVRAQGVVSHVFDRAIPSKSFARISQEIYVSSPELTFLQMAETLSIYQLIALGFEYCGTYTLGEDGLCSYGVRPITSSRKLARYLCSLSAGVKGVEKARKAITYVLDGSASPMETVLCMLLTLPKRMGGYGLPKPSLNKEVKLNEKARRVYKRRSCRCDLLFPDVGLDVEYNGREYHLGKEDSDYARANALSIMGYRCLNISAAQVRDDWALSEIARLIGAMHRKYLRKEGESAAKRYVLRKELKAYVRRRAKN